MKIAKIIAASIIVVMLLVNTYFTFVKKDVVYVDIGKVVENYKLKKDLEGKATGTLMQIKNVIDSMRLAANLQQNSFNYGALDSNVKRLEYEFGRYYGESNKDITKKVWDRLNPTLEKYGKEHQYKLIIGANGAGTVLYGDNSRDITDDFIKYCNRVYEKGN